MKKELWELTRAELRIVCEAMDKLVAQKEKELGLPARGKTQNLAFDVLREVDRQRKAHGKPPLR